VFNGKINVNAQKSVAHLINRNLLLSQTAQVDTKPELEIYKDDVKCSHGATIGCLDPNAIFYLRSRGIDQQQAEQLLIEGFTLEVLAQLQDESLKKYIQSVVLP
jgi:Fe-S cluster assembly protein SufD